MRRQFTHDEMKVEFDPGKPDIAWISCAGVTAGHAHIEVRGSTAKLIDIVIEKDMPHWNRLLRAVGCRADYRGRGAGTFFLQEIIVRLRGTGVRTLWGEMVGDIDRLIPWYRGLGFVVDADTRRIVLNI